MIDIDDRVRRTHRMFKKTSVLTHPTPARRDAPLRGQGRGESDSLKLVIFFRTDGPIGLTRARVERGPSEGARSASTRDDRVAHPYFLSDVRTQLEDFFTILI